jgi:hypothetical protein
MDISYLSIIIFSIITIIYYLFPSVGKIPITIDILKNNNLQSYYNSNLTRIALYFLVVVVTQFGLNAMYLINKCGGSSGSNVGVAALITFIPWVLIFGIMMGLLIIYPGLKIAFSDVIGFKNSVLNSAPVGICLSFKRLIVSAISSGLSNIGVADNKTILVLESDLSITFFKFL